MPTISSLQNNINQDFATESYKRLMDDHFSLIKNLTSNRVIAIKPYEAIKYKGDFYGLLRNSMVDDSVMYISMKINGYNSFSQYEGERTEFTIADASFVRSIYLKSTIVST